MASSGSTAPRHEIVSNEAEQLILVDAHDNEVGYASKAAAHNGDGVLHRAFSLFIFNQHNELLLQQRAGGKRLWGGYWSNSCCSHPRRGEALDQAVHRRLHQELGMTAQLEHVYSFQYQASFGAAGSEHELCHVYVGRATSAVDANRSEVDDYRFVPAAEVGAAVGREPERYTPWFKLEWERLCDEFPQLIGVAEAQ